MSGVFWFLINIQNELFIESFFQIANLCFYFLHVRKIGKYCRNPFLKQHNFFFKSVRKRENNYGGGVRVLGHYT